MRVGLTQLDPCDQRALPRFAMPNLVSNGTSWVFGIGDNSNNKFGVPSRDIIIKDNLNVHTSRGTIPYSALKPNVMGKSQSILPTDTGSRIGVMYLPKPGTDGAEMHFIINGEDQGVCVCDLPYKFKPLHAVVDVYGTTKQVRIVQLYGGECCTSSWHLCIMV